MATPPSVPPTAPPITDADDEFEECGEGGDVGETSGIGEIVVFVLVGALMLVDELGDRLGLVVDTGFVAEPVSSGLSMVNICDMP